MNSAAKQLIFISYSRKDKDKVDELERKLQARGVRTWLDTQDIVAGEWRLKIKSGLRQSNFFVACLSQNTVERGEVLQYEYDAALEIQRDRLEGDVYLIPVRLEPCEIPACLAHLQVLDVYQADGFFRLLRALRSKERQRTAPAIAAAAVAVVLVLAGAYLSLRPGVSSDFLDARATGKSAPVTNPMRVGATLWKMDPANASDVPAVREIVHPPAAGENATPAAWTPVRLPAGAQFALGDKFQVGIESSRSGFLYVVDRALRKDKSLGPATLIFPTNRIHNGDNRVWPGRLVRLPDRQSHPPYWVFDSNRPDYDGEVLVIVVTARPLEGFSAQDDAVAVPERTVEDWLSRYGNGVRVKTTGTGGLRLTVAEAAARDGDAQLPRSAPLPEYLFEAQRGADSALAVSLPIPVSQTR